MGLFDGKIVIVTGGSMGIGRAAAVDFAREGAKVVVVARREDEGQETVRLMHEIGGDGFFFKADVSQESDVKAMIEETVKAYGRLDCAFNNAGIEQKPTPLFEQTEQDFARVMDINVKGVWLCMKHQIPIMLKGGGGAIVNTSSLSGVIAFATIPIYVASKHAVIGLTKAVALEFAKQGIRVNAVCPGAIGETGTLERSFGGSEEAMKQTADTYPIGRVGTPQEIASTALFLCSDAASFITGAVFSVDGGYTAQ